MFFFLMVTYNRGIDLVVAIAMVFVATASDNITCLSALHFSTFLLLVLVSLSLEGM